ncbi:hypothetical protein [Vulcaniibacterium thermophilum]|uniref:Lipoprotein n=2 Tax=Vulcaniibacterium thermophilum TaxID=1169913 RepID=A0A918YWU4_9GAMM|nr:hypothetical protein [Vulcaniibacterium thermophilum]GHE25186.1 hypothetical protein GCM10007167_01670 [Vulcaniibacterium thermophilum]
MPDSTPLKVEAGLMLCMLLAITACTAAGAPDVEAARFEPVPVATPTPTEGRPMIAPDTRPPTPEPPDGPQLTPEQVWRKLMGLIDSLRDETDLNRGHIERAIGLPLQQHDGSVRMTMIAGRTTGGWHYAFKLMTYSKADRRVAFDVYVPELSSSNGVAPTCTFPFRQLHDALLARGFEARNLTATGDRAYSWTFSRPPLVLNTYYYFLRPQEMDEANYDEACVDRVVMSFVIPAEGSAR